MAQILAIDIIKLLIITDLRKIGCPIDKIKNVLHKIANEKVGLYRIEHSSGEIQLHRLKEQKNEEENIKQLEYCTLASLCGEKIILSIDEEDNSMFLVERDFVAFNAKFDYCGSPLIVLPFFWYADTLAKQYGNINIKIRDGSTISDLFRNHLTEQEKNIIDIIRNKEYQEITIMKTDNEEINIKATSWKEENLLTRKY